MTARGAFHEAQRLDGRLRRLDARRARQIEAVESAYQADLMLILQSVQPWLRAMVRKAIAEDPSAPPRLVDDLEKAGDQLDPHERETEPPLSFELQPKPPYPTMPRLPSRLLHQAPDEQPLESELPPSFRREAIDDVDGNHEWGLEVKEANAADMRALEDREDAAESVPLTEAELDALDLLEAGPEPVTTADVLRYPEPGEAAIVLPTGEIVAAP